MKRIACLMLSFIIMIGASVSAYAAQPTDEAEPQSLYSSKPTVVFLISENGKASVKLKCMGNRDVTKITSKTCIDIAVLSPDSLLSMCKSKCLYLLLLFWRWELHKSPETSEENPLHGYT